MASLRIDRGRRLRAVRPHVDRGYRGRPALPMGVSPDELQARRQAWSEQVDVVAVWGDADIPEWRCDARCVPWRLSLMRGPPVRLSAAVHNNAAWCDAVCRALGGDTTRVDGLWVNRSPSPPFYPNAVTLEPFDTAAQLSRLHSMLDSVLPRPWAVKDSYQRLDLVPLGFEVLFEAEWIGLPADHELPDPAISGPAWATVRSDADLLAWERALHGGSTAAASAGVARVFDPALLDDPDIRFLAGTQRRPYRRRDGREPFGRWDRPRRGHLQRGADAGRSADGWTRSHRRCARCVPWLAHRGLRTGRKSRRDARPWLSTPGVLAGVAHASWWRRSPSELRCSRLRSPSAMLARPSSKTL